MGAYDGAEVCELVGTFSLDKIGVEYDKNSIDLYHDNRLSIFKNSTWNNKKELTKNTEGLWFKIAAESNLKTVNYLDVALNLNDGSFRPCDKSDGIIQYINKEFNNPPNLIKHLQASIEKQLSNNSFDKKYFKNRLFIMKIH